MSRKVTELLFEDEKIVSMLNSSFSVTFFFGGEGSRHDSAGSVSRIQGKEGSRFTFKVDAFVGDDRLDGVK